MNYYISFIRWFCHVYFVQLRITSIFKWYEVFAMVRMGCCILRTQELLRSIGQGDHFLTRAPILPAWTVEA